MRQAILKTPDCGAYVSIGGLADDGPVLPDCGPALEIVPAEGMRTQAITSQPLSAETEF